MFCDRVRLYCIIPAVNFVPRGFFITLPQRKEVLRKTCVMSPCSSLAMVIIRQYCENWSSWKYLGTYRALVTFRVKVRVFCLLFLCVIHVTTKTTLCIWVCVCAQKFVLTVLVLSFVTGCMLHFGETAPPIKVHSYYYHLATFKQWGNGYEIIWIKQPIPDPRRLLKRTMVNAGVNILPLQWAARCLT